MEPLATANEGEAVPHAVFRSELSVKLSQENAAVVEVTHVDVALTPVVAVVLLCPGQNPLAWVGAINHTATRRGTRR